MKIRDYISLYYDGIVSGDEEVMQKMVKTLHAEMLAELMQIKYKGQSRYEYESTVAKKAHELLGKYNHKGNQITDRVNAKAGVQLMKTDWFKRCVIINEPKNDLID